MTTEIFILASSSLSRIRMLRAAGVAFEAVAPAVDEAALKEALLAEGAAPRAIADALAETKAIKISQRWPGRLVLGCDQVLKLDDGAMMDKAETMAEAKSHLLKLAGREHQLISAAVMAVDGQPVWRVVDTATLTMRAMSEINIDLYLNEVGETILSSVGCYHLEGHGVQLFSHIKGDFFTILGLPLLPVLDYLRLRGVMPL